MEHLPGRVLITFARFDGRGCLRDADPKARRLTLDGAFGLEPSWRIGVLADPFRPHEKFAGTIAHARDADRRVNFEDRCHDTLRSKTKAARDRLFRERSIERTLILVVLRLNYNHTLFHLRRFRRTPGGTKITGAEGRLGRFGLFVRAWAKYLFKNLFQNSIYFTRREYRFAIFK
jgi:hypothetical protein